MKTLDYFIVVGLIICIPLTLWATIALLMRGVTCSVNW